MELPKGLPGPIRELLPYLSPRALQVVDLAAMARATARLGRQWLVGTGFSHAYQELGLALPVGVTLGRVKTPFAWADLPLASRRRVGEKLLAIYFRQIFSDHPLFFDLRLARLAWNDGILTWEPSKAFFAMEPNFRRSLQNLYRGYYQPDLNSLKTALRELKLVAQGADAAAEEQVVELLLHRFSGGREGAVKFSTAQFRQSFDSLFGLVLQSGNRLSPDFAFVGLLLASLFISLEALDVELDVLPQYRAAVGARI